jgi:hypothetical protein
MPRRFGRKRAAKGVPNRAANFAIVGFEREVTRVVKAHFSLWAVVLEGFGARSRKNGSFLPHTASSGVWLVRKYPWNLG